MAPVTLNQIPIKKITRKNFIVIFQSKRKIDFFILYGKKVEMYGNALIFRRIIL